MRTKESRHPVFSLRFRLVLVVAMELVASVFLAVWISNLLQEHLPADWEIPLLLYLIIVSLLVGTLVTALLSTAQGHESGSRRRFYRSAADQDEIQRDPGYLCGLQFDDPGTAFHRDSPV